MEQTDFPGVTFHDLVTYVVFCIHGPIKNVVDIGRRQLYNSTLFLRYRQYQACLIFFLVYVLVKLSSWLVLFAKIQYIPVTKLA